MGKEKDIDANLDQEKLEKIKEGKKKALETAMEKLNKQYGKGSIMLMGEKVDCDVDVIPTGAPNLDFALGVGGIPKGRITEIYGAEASGKTTLTLHIASEAQKLDQMVAFIDVEHALDPVYARNIGVNTDALLLSQPDGGEQALEIVEQLVRSSAVDLIIVDSVAALVPRQEVEGSMGDSHVGLQARLMSQALRKLTSIVSKSNTAVIFINQTRMKIGAPAYTNPETTTGGVALKFYSTVRLEVRAGSAIKAPDNSMLGKNTHIKIVKNKLAPPFRTVEFPIIFGKGISILDIIINESEKHGIIERGGSWYSYNDIKLGQGAAKVKELLESDKKILESIKKDLYEKYK